MSWLGYAAHRPPASARSCPWGFDRTRAKRPLGTTAVLLAPSGSRKSVLLSHARPAPIVYSHGLGAAGPVSGVGGVTGS